VSTRERTYRFGPLDRGGWVLGLGGSQCIAVALGIVLGGFVLNTSNAGPLALAPVVAGAAYAFATVHRQPMHELAPAAARYAISKAFRRARWMAALPLLSGSTGRACSAPLPPFLDGLSIIDVGPAGWSPLSAAGGVGLVLDARERTLSGSLRVHGREFPLLERIDQERLVQLWGDALAGFCSERTAVSRVRVTEWAAPAGVAAHERYLAVAGVRAAGSDAHASYAQLLADAGPAATAHDLLLTVTIDLRRVPRRRAVRQPVTDQAAEVLLEELRLLTGRLETAGLSVDPPLSASGVAEVLRLRCDPSCITGIEGRRRSLAALAGAVSPYNCGPIATDASWSMLRADASLHRTYWVAEWPRLEMGPNWLEPLLLHAGGVRTIAIHYEPVPPSRAQRRIDRDATRLAADEEQRARSGFRIGARHRRAEEAVLEREAELVAGYAELEFAGFVTVTSTDEESLTRSCAEYEQAAAQAGLELRPLDGRQDVAFVCSLPIGRGVAARRWAP